MLIIYNSIGYIYHKQENGEQAIKYAFKALAIAKEIGAKVNITYINILIGAIYAKLGEPKLARKYLLEALSLAQEFGYV